jgi:hypothetical protein
MTSEELLHIAHQWIAFQHSFDISQSSPETKGLEWTYDAVCEMLEGDPEDAWKLILMIHGLDQSECVNQILSAGPFEDFMEINGPAYIDRVEAEVQRDKSFARIVAGIYQGKIKDEIWQRLQPLAKIYEFR